MSAYVLKFSVEGCSHLRRLRIAKPTDGQRQQQQQQQQELQQRTTRTTAVDGIGMSLEELWAHAERIVKETPGGPCSDRLWLLYTDDEGDLITILSPADWAEAQRQVVATGKLRLHIRQLQQQHEGRYRRSSSSWSMVSQEQPSEQPSEDLEAAVAEAQAEAEAQESTGSAKSHHEEEAQQPVEAEPMSSSNTGEAFGAGAGAGAGAGCGITSAVVEAKPAVAAVAPTAVVARLMSAGFCAVSCIGGSLVQKTFVFRNEGKTVWPAGCCLQFKAGCRAGGPVEGVPVAGSIAPGSTAALRLTLVAPQQPGTYVTYWQLVDGQGRAVSPRVWIDMAVTAPHDPHADPCIMLP